MCKAKNGCKTFLHILSTVDCWRWSMAQWAEILSSSLTCDADVVFDRFLEKFIGGVGHGPGGNGFGSAVDFFVDSGYPWFFIIRMLITEDKLRIYCVRPVLAPDFRALVTSSLIRCNWCYMVMIILMICNVIVCICSILASDHFYWSFANHFFYWLFVIADASIEKCVGVWGNIFHSDSNSLNALCSAPKMIV